MTMALSLSNYLYAICGVLMLMVSTAHTATVTYDFNVGWVTRNPDGQFARPVIGINGQWPIPSINITKGDRLIVNVFNQLGNQSTSLHFHGIFQNGTTDMDGVVGVTQCGIPPGSNFTYDFVIDQPGTYWYHSHLKGQYPDGLRGPVFVNDPDSPYLGQYDEEIPLTVSDWYHGQMVPLMRSFSNFKDPTGAEPIPDAALMNDTQNLTRSIEPGKTYFLRIVNIGGFAGQYFWIQGQKMKVIQVDGVWTQPQEVDMLYASVAQRYGVLITAPNDTSIANIPMITSMDTSMFDVTPPTLNTNATGWLVLDQSKPLITPTILDEFNPYDDLQLVPHDLEPLFENPTQRIQIEFEFNDLGDGVNYAFINNVTYVAPTVPTLYTALSAGTQATDQSIYGHNTNTFMLEHNQVVELVLNNLDTGRHPFHLHGHDFQAVYRAAENVGTFDPSTQTLPNNISSTPMRRDTLLVYPGAYYVLRFRSDNPGVWFFHCHIEWHVDSGLLATIVEAPLQMQQQFGNFPSNSFSAQGRTIDFNGSVADRPIPYNHLQACEASNVKYVGNAAGNTENFLDLTGEPTSPKPLPSGFTARGIVALVFSCISAFLGMGVIAWYGSIPISFAEEKRMEARVHKIEKEAVLSPTSTNNALSGIASTANS